MNKNFNNTSNARYNNYRLDTRSLLPVSNLKLDYDLKIGGYTYLPNTSFKTVLNRVTQELGSVNSSLEDLNDAATNIQPYKVYTALLTQSGTSDPVPIVLENTLGTTITWTRDGAGNYSGTFGTPITNVNKVFINAKNTFPSGGSPARIEFEISTTDISIYDYAEQDMHTWTAALTGRSGQANTYDIEIRIYP